VNNLRAKALVGVFVFLAAGARAQDKAPIALTQTIPLPGLHDGNFDHFAVDLPERRAPSASRLDWPGLDFAPRPKMANSKEKPKVKRLPVPLLVM
jgi:hypothetical protein